MVELKVICGSVHVYIHVHVKALISAPKCIAFSGKHYIMRAK